MSDLNTGKPDMSDAAKALSLVTMHRLTISHKV